MARTKLERGGLPVAAVLLVLCGQVHAQPGIADVESALSARDFPAAVAAADAYLATDPGDADHALYLKALAALHAERLDAAVAAAGRVVASHPRSPWLEKARFLLARAHVERREYAKAQEIYEEEANRLLSEKRKHEIAGLLVEFADDLARAPDPSELAPPPDRGKAIQLYQKALALEIGRGLRDELLFKIARTRFVMATLDKPQASPQEAMKDLRTYLGEFDPDWLGRVGSRERRSGLARQNPPPPGRHRFQARLLLARLQTRAGQLQQARVNVEDLQQLLAGEAAAKELAADARAELGHDAAWQMVLAHRMPSPPALEPAVKAARDYLAAFADGRHAVQAAFWIGKARQRHGRSDDAVAAYEAFLEGRGFRLPPGDAATEPLEPGGRSPAELRERYGKEATYAIAQIRFAQQRYGDAIEVWQRYVSRFPNGPDWSRSQQGIVNARYQLALAAVEDGKLELAGERLDGFVRQYPLDARSRQAMFIMGQMHHHRAARLEEEGAADDAVRRAYQQAVDAWLKLVEKHPRTEEASVALYRVGLVREEQLGDLEGALASYRRLDWGSKAGAARARVALMTRKELELDTERAFRTDEQAEVRLRLRNIEKVTVRQYVLDLERFFLKTHGISGIEALDIGLIEPDRTWELEVDDYRKYAPLERAVPVPFPDGRPGVCILHVGEEDLESSTLVIRSDLDLIVKSSRREVIAFVQDRRTGRPAPDVRILLSDGEQVFARGTTGDDGVFRGRYEELEHVAKLKVFAAGERGLASSGLDLEGLSLSKGLSPRGYVYTDRPAYLPGQTAGVRGILRDVRRGSYALPEEKTWVLAVRDQSSRLVWEEEVGLSGFGTFEAEVRLTGAASLGTYTVSVHPKGDPARTHTGTFLVQRFQLQKMKLELETERPVFYRGESVEVTATASYYWGEPVTDREVRWVLPDGVQGSGRTDDEGRVSFSWASSGVTGSQAVAFSATIVGEGVSAAHRVFVSASGFQITVTPSQPVALSGEPFEARIVTRTPDGEPAGRKLVLTVLRRVEERRRSLLDGVPWVGRRPSVTVSEVTVSEHPVETDARTGEAVVRLDVEKGGTYVLRASGEDRFDQVVTGAATVQVSDDEDATRLRLFAESGSLDVGEKATLRLHSRVEEGLALVTFEGEEIIEHRVVAVEGGYNDLPLEVGHEHFPNFTLSVAMMEDRELRTVSKPFTVERRLEVTVKPVEDVHEPGSKGRVEILVTDQLGHPVVAELSLSLVDQALYALYPESAPDIVAYFQEGAERQAFFRAESTCDFAYDGATRQVLKQILEERERLEAQSAAQEEYRRARADLKRMLVADRVAPGEAGRRPAAEPEANEEEAPAEAIPHLSAGGGGAAGGKRVADSPALRLKNKSGWSALDFDVELGADAKLLHARRELPSAGHWIASVVTDDEGRAVVDVPLPESTSEWRLTSRGCTVETLVGADTATAITRKRFFATLKTPRALMQGDRPRIVARLHNLTEKSGPVDAVLTVATASGRLLERRTGVRIPAEGSVEVVFDGFDVPAATEVELRVSAAGQGLEDALVRKVPVRPFGLEYADHAGGLATGPRTLHLELPGGREYVSRWLSITVAPGLSRGIVAMALDRPPVLRSSRRMCFPSPDWSVVTGGELLAVVSALEYARPAPDVEDRRRLMERARALVGALVVSQRKDGGWGWPVGAGREDLPATGLAYWGLARARAAGIPVEERTLDAAAHRLKQAFVKAGSTDYHRKALLQHALSSGGQADFAPLNRLYRQRQTLGPAALAAVALAFDAMDRKEIALELCVVLESKAQRGDEGVFWRPTGDDLGWMGSAEETTALALLALSRVSPGSSLVPPSADWLLGRRGSWGVRPARGRGPVVAALAARFELVAEARRDLAVRVVVNGKEAGRFSADGDADPVLVEVPAELVSEGRNRVELLVAGRGEYVYAATLRGFSPEFRSGSAWSRPRVRARDYHHAPLRYRGRPISAHSTSPVGNLEIGQQVRVRVDIRRGWRRGHYSVVEEPLPAGTRLVPGSVSGRFTRHQVEDGRLVLVVPPGQPIDSFQYELVAFAPGEYRVLPTVIRDLADPGQTSVGAESVLTVLDPGASSSDPYVMNDSERYQLGRLLFEDGRFDDARKHLLELRGRSPEAWEKEVARMLLWIGTAEGHYDARMIVDMFEILRERYPDLYIPFDRILVVGRAYEDLGEMERSWLVFRATIDASFVKDSNVSAVLEDAGQFLGSVEYQKRLWREYPDTPEVRSAWFALTQALYRAAPRARELEREQRRRTRSTGGGNGDGDEPLTPARLWLRSVEMLARFLTLYPEDPLADDAAFSMTNALLKLKDYDRVVELGEVFRKRHPESVYATGFRYMSALGHFWRRAYDEALSAALKVAEGESKDRDFARYILGQIHHARGNAEEAIGWYEKVRELYPDAREAIAYFQQKHVRLPEVTVVVPGEPVELELEHRNIEEAALQIYKVDLMRLYLREKNLSEITKVNLAGISSQLDLTKSLGDGKDYRDVETKLRLDLKEEGAYLVICRGDHLFTSGLVLVTPLQIEAQEDSESGRVRVNVLDVVRGIRPAEVHVKAIGSGDTEFQSGETDLRGVFVADGIDGRVTVIARSGDARYAFHRGTRSLGAGERDRGRVQRSQTRKKEKEGVNYLDNLDAQNESLQRQNLELYDRLRRAEQKGVQIRKAK